MMFSVFLTLFRWSKGISVFPTVWIQRGKYLVLACLRRSQERTESWISRGKSQDNIWRICFYIISSRGKIQIAYIYKITRKPYKATIILDIVHLSSHFNFQVSLDSRVREIINRNMITPSISTFDDAQLQIYTLMHRDSYPRFVSSVQYKNLLQSASASSPTDGGGGREERRPN